jgi:ubiquinone/menaquinone biosynthesis C-methylase UbiE
MRKTNRRPTRTQQSTSTSWQPVSEWYQKSVGESGHYYHEHIVLPNTLKLLQLNEESSLLDLGCGQGVLERQIPSNTYYQGYDISSSLIEYAKDHLASPAHHFGVADVTRATIPLQKKDFTHSAIILALQNMEKPENALKNAATHLRSGGKLVVVLNHPCFRIPRQSSWGIDEEKKTQYRRVDRYFSPMKIPITAHPGKTNSPVTWSFHEPISFYTHALASTGFTIETIEEWNSDKQSIGRSAKMENRGRAEFPLFLTFVVRKK